jgi:hypothetical protein
MSTENLINALKDGDNIASGAEFNNIMAQKLSDALDAKRIEVGSTMIDRVTTKEEE